MPQKIAARRIIRRFTSSGIPRELLLFALDLLLTLGFTTGFATGFATAGEEGGIFFSSFTFLLRLLFGSKGILPVVGLLTLAPDLASCFYTFTVIITV
jgi:hypothetical protein